MKKALSVIGGLLLFCLCLNAGPSPSGATGRPKRSADGPVKPFAVVERCSSIIVGSKATKDGSVILAHNEDLANYCAHHYVYKPHLKHGQGDVFTSYWGAAVPQPAETYGYTATKIFDKSYVPGDVTSGINEYQVSVVNNMSYRRDAPSTLPTHGRLIWTEFTQLALERAKTAREAVRIIGGLAHTYKLGSDSGTIYGVADPSEGWWVEVTLEGQWVAQRVPDDAVGVRANIFRIGVVDFKDSRNFMYSDDLVTYAAKMGWHSGTGSFDFSKVYAASEKLDDPYNTRRQWRAEELLKKRISSITPRHVISVLRDHYEGTPYDLTDGHKKGSPHQTDERTLCSINTEVSAVSHLRSWLPADVGAVSWRAMATPCTSAYTPWYLGSREVPVAYRTGTNQHTQHSAYWTFREVSRFADVRYETVSEGIGSHLEAFEGREFEAQARTEKEAASLLLRNGDSGRRFLSDYSNKMAEKAMRLGNSLVD